MMIGVAFAFFRLCLFWGARSEARTRLCLDSFSVQKGKHDRPLDFPHRICFRPCPPGLVVFFHGVKSHGSEARVRLFRA